MKVFLRQLSPALLLLLIVCSPGMAASAQEPVCLTCHGSQPSRLGEPVKQWRGSIHDVNGISCHHCHGGDPSDIAMAMSPERGFIGVPKKEEIPGFCGRCHVGVNEDYLQSAHGKALGKGGPECVTCHGSHRVTASSPELINPRDCSRCHSYGRAEEIKSAVIATDRMIDDTERRLARLHRLGFDTTGLKGEVFSLRNSFHRTFHSVNVEKVKSRTSGFQGTLSAIGGRISTLENAIARREFWGGIATLLLACGGVLAFLIFSTYRGDGE